MIGYRDSARSPHAARRSALRLRPAAALSLRRCVLGRKTDAIKGVVPCAHPGRVLHSLAAPVTMPLTGARWNILYAWGARARRHKAVRYKIVGEQFDSCKFRLYL